MMNSTEDKSRIITSNIIAAVIGAIIAMIKCCSPSFSVLS